MLLRKPIIFILLTASVVMAGCACGASTNGVEKMGRRVESELPIGSTEAQVAKFLDQMDVKHGEPMVSTYDENPRHRGLLQTGGTIENFWHSEPSMYLNFYFDKDGKLVESTVTNACGRGCYSIRPNTTGTLRDFCD
jgi:hypothetical protein